MSHPPLETWGLGAALGSFGREGRAPSSGLKGQGYQDLWPNSLRAGTVACLSPSLSSLYFSLPPLSSPVSLSWVPSSLLCLIFLLGLPCSPVGPVFLVTNSQPPGQVGPPPAPSPQALHGPRLSRGQAGRRGPRSGVCKGLAAKPLTRRGGGSRICWVLFPPGRGQRRRSGGGPRSLRRQRGEWDLGTFPQDFSPQPGAEQAGAARGPRSARPSPARPLSLRCLQLFFCTCLVYI